MSDQGLVEGSQSPLRISEPFYLPQDAADLLNRFAEKGGTTIPPSRFAEDDAFCEALNAALRRAAEAAAESGADDEEGA